MADWPILFSGPMVRALLEGRKTQTRRLLNPQPSEQCTGFKPVFAEPPYFEARQGDEPCYAFPDPPGCRTPFPPVRVAVGDRLWVKESWRVIARYDDMPPRAFPGELSRVYRAGPDYPPFPPSRWRSAIHMPRWASRLTLEVVNVQIRRLQDISDAEAVCEGVDYETGDPAFFYVPGILPHALTAVEPTQGARGSFAKLWNHLHGPDAWAGNPWVYALSFTVRQGNVDG